MKIISQISLFDDTQNENLGDFFTRKSKFNPEVEFTFASEAKLIHYEKTVDTRGLV